MKVFGGHFLNQLQLRNGEITGVNETCVQSVTGIIWWSFNRNKDRVCTILTKTIVHFVLRIRINIQLGIMQVVKLIQILEWIGNNE